MGRFPVSLRSGRNSQCRSVVGPRSRRGSHDMFVAVIAELVSLKSTTVLIAAIAATALDALPAVAGPERLAHVLASEVTRPPAGWVDFCARQPSECASTATAPRELTLSPQTWKDLVRVNNWVNQTIKP